MRDMLLETRGLARSIGRGYGGLLLLFEAAILVMALFVLGVLGQYRQIAPSILFDPLFVEYGVAYWRVHYLWLLVAALMVTLGLAFQLDRSLYYRFFSPTAYWRIDARIRKGRKVLLVVGLFPTLYVCLTLLPLLHLFYPSWLILASALLPLPLTVTEYIALYWGDFADLNVIRSLAQNRVTTKTWNVAALGVRSVAAERELDSYARATARGPMSQEALAYIEGGAEGALWRGNERFIRRVAETIGVPAESIELHDRTTGALRRAMEEIVNRPDRADWVPVVMASDNDYESVTTLLDELAAKRRIELRRVAIRERIWHGASARDMSSTILANIDLKPNPNVIFLPHVTHDTGYVLDLPYLMAEVDRRRRNGDTAVWIVDGAQAIGNIAPSPEVLDRADYYATSGHKWLGGKPTIGMLYRNPNRVQEQWRLPNDRSLSRLGDRGSAGTINLEAHVSLNAMLCELLSRGLDVIAQHNVELARRLSEFLQRDAGLAPILSVPQNGIVTVEGEAAQIEQLSRRLKGSGVETTFYAFGARGGLRFCCHYCHSEVDVYELVGRVVSQLRSAWN